MLDVHLDLLYFRSAMTSNEESSQEMYICSVCNIILQTEHEEWICTACYLSDSYAYKYAIPKDTENND